MLQVDGLLRSRERDICRALCNQWRNPGMVGVHQCTHAATSHRPSPRAGPRSDYKPCQEMDYKSIDQISTILRLYYANDSDRLCRVQAGRQTLVLPNTY
jgi:hypothetical protein